MPLKQHTNWHIAIAIPSFACVDPLSIKKYKINVAGQKII
jgi:ligand-binding SRPBCC domain-containing protein